MEEYKEAVLIIRQVPFRHQSLCSHSHLCLGRSNTLAVPNAKRAVAYYNPLDNGGSMLTDGAYFALEVIISGLSSAEVLTDDGFLNFARAIGLQGQSALYIANIPTANFGDGNGWVNQTEQLREDYGMPRSVCTCLESLIGGNHLRQTSIFPQNGSEADSGAYVVIDNCRIFSSTFNNFRVSKEEDVFESHDIVPDGYDIGTNDLVSAAVGSTSYDHCSEHYSSLLVLLGDINHDISIDGIVTVLTVSFD
ncbi:hypothetical protein BT96DRAFT_817684 [Gymnopus androsaceus JB14]|uniref:Uncharacterized protein n=1 Tax=Gymnopus androsaceus JB14 TaxID=1447944 RepID=A0A6A4HYB4_9AGAR|nr:hypothetical protein BT96DRAFT_817684 [Gymnopus androsaceus JB14]